MSRRFLFTLLSVAAALSLLAALSLDGGARDGRMPGYLFALFSAALFGFALALLSRNAPSSSAAPHPDQANDVSTTSERASSASASALLEATMNGMREGVIVVDRSLRVVASNRAARDIFSHVSDSIDSLRLTELTRNSSIHAAFSAAVDDNQRAEVKVETRGAERRMLELRVEPLRLEYEAGAGRDGNTQRDGGAIGVFFDITQLEKLERVRQEFLSNVSHELRTPLTAILAFVETLEDGAINDAENNHRFLAVIRKNAARMHNLIDDILELSAIEAGMVTVEPAPIRLQPIVGDVMTSLAARAAAREVTVHNEVEAEALVYADPRRLEQMLTNLVDNAIKFNRPGGKVTIRCERANNRDRISVIDNGDGISAEHVERIFERFYRVDRARSREMGGTGLGLAIVKHLARAHGGETNVSSTLGQGSVFTVELQIAPLATAPPTNISEPQTSRPVATH